MAQRIKASYMSYILQFCVIQSSLRFIYLFIFYVPICFPRIAALAVGRILMLCFIEHKDIEPVTSNSEKLQSDKSISICSLQALQSQIIVSLSAPNKSICFFPSVVQGSNLFRNIHNEKKSS